MLFVFDNKDEVEKILAGEPWSFDRHLVVLQKMDNTTPVQDLSLNKVSLWVQVHNIPFSFLNKGVMEELCEVVGEVNRSSKDADVEGGSYIRVRVRVDISLPLCGGRVLSIEGSEDVWISFKYERLPNICYWCGCLNHFDRDCDLWIESDGSLDRSAQEYGAWIRASITSASKKSVVTVPGFYETM